MDIVWILLGGSLAFVNGRSLIGWSLTAAFLGPIPLIVLALLPKKEDKIAERAEFFRSKSESFVIKQEFKEVATVDDLFKQLETPRG